MLCFWFFRAFALILHFKLCSFCWWERKNIFAPGRKPQDTPLLRHCNRDLLHLIENTFDQKRIYANPSSYPNPITLTLTLTLTLTKRNNVFGLTKWRHFSIEIVFMKETEQWNCFLWRRRSSAGARAFEVEGSNLKVGKPKFFLLILALESHAVNNAITSIINSLLQSEIILIGVASSKLLFPEHFCNYR